MTVIDTTVRDGAAPISPPPARAPFRLGFLTHLEGHLEPGPLLRGMVDIFVAAEQLGFETGWVAQHHFESGTDGPGAGAAPLVFLSAVAARTGRIGLGTAVVIAPLESPLRLAEDAATLDLLSGGRLELGLGSGYDGSAFETFGADFDDRRAATSAAVDLLDRALSGQVLGEAGHVLHPRAPDLRRRVWQGIFSEEGAAYAARAGSGLLLNRAAYGYDEPTDIVQRPWAERYLAQWRASPPDGGRAPRIGLSRLVYPAADRAAARAWLGPGVLKAAERLAAQGRFPVGLDLDGYLQRFHAFYGHPEEVAAQLAAERVLPLATDLLCQVNPGVPDFAETIRVLEAIATRIAPALGWQPATASAPAGANTVRAS